MAQPDVAGLPQPATCARCGFCCRAIGVHVAPRDVLGHVIGQVAAGEDPGDWLFFLQHWHPLGRKQAAAINPRLREGARQRDHFYTAVCSDQGRRSSSPLRGERALLHTAIAYGVEFVPLSTPCVQVAVLVPASGRADQAVIGPFGTEASLPEPLMLLAVTIPW